MAPLAPAGPPRAVWVVMVEPPTPPIDDPMLGGHPAGTPLALFPPRWGIDKLLPVVDSFVQLLDPNLVDKLDYRQMSHVPYPARVVGYGMEVEGGWNPTVVAFKVQDLQVFTEDETGIESVTFTRVPPSAPEWLLRERELGLR
ncbi:hypothetical protein GCM10022239_11720 [Leifsonia bigeumensis]|uniref:Uncharacterized protein n=1 Tax=Leifsonella bigeumensis TaxID=433643 RepID=A0ABP7FEJ3_9MICO